MRLLAHRGFWQKESERNSRDAFIRAFELGWGIETDIRDSNGRLVISHDVPHGTEMDLEELFQILNGRTLPLALNIKSDGLQYDIMKLIKTYNHSEYFVFDMSIPELVVYIARGLRSFTGVSDIMPVPPLLSQAQGVWLDCFNGDWYGSCFIDTLFKSTPSIAVVSPDLHHRPYYPFWNMLNLCGEIENPNLFLCTDHPDEAQKFFGSALCS